MIIAASSAPFSALYTALSQLVCHSLERTLKGNVYWQEAKKD